MRARIGERHGGVGLLLRRSLQRRGAGLVESARTQQGVFEQCQRVRVLCCGDIAFAAVLGRVDHRMPA